MSSSTAFGVLLLRVSLGAMWIAHALLKLFVFTLPGTAKFLSFPSPQAGTVFAKKHPPFALSNCLVCQAIFAVV